MKELEAITETGPLSSEASRGHVLQPFLLVNSKKKSSTFVFAPRFLARRLATTVRRRLSFPPIAQRHPLFLHPQEVALLVQPCNEKREQKVQWYAHRSKADL
jgi:hypothetical protein